MNIYKIDSLHRHVLIDNGGCIKSNSPTQHEFDLPNRHTYNEKGELIGERDLGKMDLDFCNKLTSIKPVERVEDFLDYQLENSEDKLTFFKHIKTGVIVNSYKISNSPARQQVLIDWIKEKKNKLEETPKEETEKPTKDKLTNKQQILLLNQLGFFDLDFFNDLNETQKGVLVSHIVNRDEKNSEDNVRYVRGKKTKEETRKIFTEKNIKTVNELLEKIGLKQYKIE